MSRLRFPFRTQSSSQVINGDAILRNGGGGDDVINDSIPLVLEKEKGKSKEREVERLWGLENFGNTCYCNSVLQALYACEPFRQFIESYGDAPPPISALAPPPGESNKPTAPSSPLATKTSNPFDNPTLTNPGAATSPPGKRGLFSRRPTSSSSAATPGGASTASTAPAAPTAPPDHMISEMDIPPVTPNPKGPPPSVFETIQTLFFHLSTSMPHQPLPVKKEQKQNAENAQTASLLPSEAAAPPANGEGGKGSNAPGSPPSNKEPQGPPLLASLPPPSAPRGGGPFQAGTLGRGVVRPEDLLKTVKRENDMFRGMSQQDAHEFLGWVLNKVAEDVEIYDRSMKDAGKSGPESVVPGRTFVQRLFEGVLTNETRCLSCETTSSRDEAFLDLSIDIEQHTSVTACLRQFSTSEMLCQKNKFFCDSCCGLQEAEKRMKIKRLPNILALHLKRFKYQESLGRYTKLFYRVPFPTTLRLPNTADDTVNPDRLYELFAVVVHIGNGPHHGHYVCLIRSAGRWVMCDDENVEPIEDSDIFRYFGDYPSGAGYVLFYQAVDLKASELGLKPIPKRKPPQKSAQAVAAAAVAAAAATPVSQELDGIQEHVEAPAHDLPSSPERSPTQPLSLQIPNNDVVAPAVSASEREAAAPAAPPSESKPAATEAEAASLAPPVATPAAPVPAAQPAASPASTTSTPTPATPTPAANRSPTQPTTQPNGGLARQTSANRVSMPPSSKPIKEEGNKWYKRRKSTSSEKDSQRRTSLLAATAPNGRLAATPERDLAQPVGPTPPRQPSANLGTSPNMTDASTSPSAGAGANAMSSSFVSTQSTTSSTSNSLSQSVSSNTGRVGGLSPTAPSSTLVGGGQNQRDRTISGSSQSSSSAFGTSAEKANGNGKDNGTALGRRMSGLGRMGSRKGSMSFGKLIGKNK